LKVLQEVWVLTALPCGKYMAAVMGDLLERLLRFRELGRVRQDVSEEVLAELVSMSGATIDRYLKPFKEALLPEAVSATKPSHILRSSIPLRTALDGFPSEPGYLEIDTVAHCGHANAGDYLVTNDATDPYTGWGVTRALVPAAGRRLRRNLRRGFRRRASGQAAGVAFDGRGVDVCGPAADFEGRAHCGAVR
jgi:hypothetical protein